MRKVTAISLSALLLMTATGVRGGDIILRLRPDAAAPIITRITATEKVLLEAAPAGGVGSWRQLELKVPFDGYVPTSALGKNFAITPGTPVRFLPDANSETITRARDGDLYEVKRVKDEWATVRYTKKLTTYFREGAVRPEPSPTPEPVVEPAEPELALTAPTHTPTPAARGFDPELGVGHTALEDLPPENVVWKTAPGARASERPAPPKSDAAGTTAPELPNGIMVSPLQTQAREAADGETPPTDQPLRLLVGQLVREIESTEPDYPIRLRSEEGRLIAYVDFSGYFVEDLSPYLNERVYLRGHLFQARSDSDKLILFVRNIQLAP
jgi:hypothetical protein